MPKSGHDFFRIIDFFSKSEKENCGGGSEDSLWSTNDKKEPAASGRKQPVGRSSLGGKANVVLLHAKSAAQRYQSAAEVSDLLGHCLAHLQQPLSVPLPGMLTPSVPIRFWRRVPFAGRALAVAVLLCVLVAVPFVLRWGRPPAVEEALAPKSLEEVRRGERTNQGSDEIEEQIHTLRVRAKSLEADLNSKNVTDSGDQIAAEIQRVLQEARLLEQEIQSGTTGAPQSLSRQPFSRR